MSSAETDNAQQGKTVLEADAATDFDKHGKRGHETNSGHEMKASELSSAAGQPSCDAPRGHCGQSVIIVQNSGDLNVEELEPSLLKCVKQVLSDTEGQNSFMIISRGKDGGESGEEQTTYIIELNSSGKQSESCKENPCTSKHDMEPVTVSSSSTGDTSSVLSSEATLASESKSMKDEVHSQGAPAFLDFEEQVEISVVSYPTHMDLNNATEEAGVSIEITCQKNESQLNGKSEHPHTSEPAAGGGMASVTRNLSEGDHSSSAFSHASQVTSASKTCFDGTSSSLPASHGSELPTDSVSSQKESQISAEYLLHMAKKMIEDKTYSRKLTAGLQPLSVAPPEVEVGEKSGPESVITMYLSSPSELKETIQKLKLNSPVIVMQAGDDLSVIEKETKENITSLGDDVEKTQPHKPVEDHLQANSSSEKFNDSLVSTLSSCDGGVVYRCAECGYSSHNKHYYKQHVDLVHNEDRPYKCPHCDYAGKRRHALLEHLVVHSNQRPFTCDHCNASFRKKVCHNVSFVCLLSVLGVEMVVLIDNCCHIYQS